MAEYGSYLNNNYNFLEMKNYLLFVSNYYWPLNKQYNICIYKKVTLNKNE